jgi:acetyl-CoA carboxylase carboxyltransferase component
MQKTHGANAKRNWWRIYREKFASPYVAAERGYIDDVIEPKETRPRLINALEMLSNKRDSNPAKKHGIFHFKCHAPSVTFQD